MLNGRGLYSTLWMWSLPITVNHGGGRAGDGTVRKRDTRSMNHLIQPSRALVELQLSRNSRLVSLWRAGRLSFSTATPRPSEITPVGGGQKGRQAYRHGDPSTQAFSPSPFRA